MKNASVFGMSKQVSSSTKKGLIDPDELIIWHEKAARFWYLYASSISKDYSYMSYFTWFNNLEEDEKFKFLDYLETH